MRPSADTGLRFIQFMTARVKLIFCRVIIIRGPHITHKTDLIDMLRQMIGQKNDVVDAINLDFARARCRIDIIINDTA